LEAFEERVGFEVGVATIEPIDGNFAEQYFDEIFGVLVLEVREFQGPGAQNGLMDLEGVVELLAVGHAAAEELEDTDAFN